MPPLDRPTLAAYVVAALLVLVLGGRWLTTRPDRGDAAGPGPPAAARAVLERPAAGSGLVVHVAGAVRRPGVYRLRDGARVRDAVRRAGGAARRADTAGLNLAAKVADGQQVLVPERAAKGAAAGPAGDRAAGGAAGGSVSLNAATAEQLDALDGIGPQTAQKILEWRARRGGFAAVDDLDEIPGIGPKRLEALRGQLTP